MGSVMPSGNGETEAALASGADMVLLDLVFDLRENLDLEVVLEARDDVAEEVDFLGVSLCWWSLPASGGGSV